MSVVRVEGYIYDDFKKDSFSDSIEYAYLFVSVPAKSNNKKIASGLRTYSYKVDVSVADEIFSELQRGDFVELYFSDNSDKAKVSFIRKFGFDKLDVDFRNQFVKAVENDLDLLDKFFG